MSYYPIFLDIRGRRCIVAGGGTVALRKVGLLLDHGAQVEVISPQLCAGISKLDADGAVKVISREYESGDLAGAFVVIAATDDRSTNERISEEARERGILVNVVDVPKLCDFIVPSYLRRGDLTVAVSTNGKSPALARKIRSEMEKDFGKEYADLVSLVEEIRSELKRRKVSISEDTWQKALDINTLLGLLRSGQGNQAREYLLKNLAEA